MKKFALLLFGLSACQQSAEPSDAASQAPASAGISGAATPADAVITFLDWYRLNQERVNQLDFVDNADAKDTTKFYTLNIPKSEMYLSALHKSGYLSDKYITGLRKYFRQQADSLRLHPQNDGPPKGLDFDFITLSQEPDVYYANPAKATQHVNLVGAHGAVVTLSFSAKPAEYQDERFFYLSQNNTNWLIDSIAVTQENLVKK